MNSGGGCARIFIKEDRFFVVLFDIFFIVPISLCLLVESRVLCAFECRLGGMIETWVLIATRLSPVESIAHFNDHIDACDALRPKVYKG